MKWPISVGERLRSFSLLDRVVIGACSLAAISAVAFVVWWYGGNDYEIENSHAQKQEEVLSSVGIFTGLPCAHAERRPFAVMLAADAVARPLSAVARADLVFEMPVTPGKIPRYMAFFQCEDPGDIGSIRSARKDFIPIAAGFGAIYVHWGGEREALSALNDRIIDNIDALKYEGSVFYRKKDLPMPHNGFTSLERLLKKADELDYLSSISFSGFSRSKAIHTQKNLSSVASSVVVDYETPYGVKWEYDSTVQEYRRYRGGLPEVDRTTQKQVAVPVVIIMETDSHILNQDYISVNIAGGGSLRVFQRGEVTQGRWVKGSDLHDPLSFVDQAGKPFVLAPGKVWVMVDTTPQ